MKEELLTAFVREYGERKFRKITKHVRSSKYTTRLQLVSVNDNSLPSGEEIVASVQSNIKYAFSSGDTLLAASMLLLHNIIEKMIEYSFEPDEQQVKEVESEIIKKVYSMSYSGSSNKILKIAQDKIQVILEMDEDKTTDTDYKLFKAIIRTSKLASQDTVLEFNERQRFEFILFLYAYSFNRLYELKPELERLIWMNVQCNVFMYLIDYANKNSLDKHIENEVEDFINSRAELYDSEIDIMKSKGNKLPTKVLNTIFESPFELNPTDSNNLSNYMILQTILREPISQLNIVTKQIIDFDYNLGSELKYKQIITNFMDNNPHVDIDSLKIIFTHPKQCKKIYHSSQISGDIPRGSEFLKAASSIDKIKNQKTLLVGAFILFDKWIKTYKEKYGENSLTNESLLLVEHQILQTNKHLENQLKK
jgi:hypothetical protein